MSSEPLGPRTSSDTGVLFFTLPVASEPEIEIVVSPCAAAAVAESVTLAFVVSAPTVAGLALTLGGRPSTAIVMGPLKPLRVTAISTDALAPWTTIGRVGTASEKDEPVAGASVPPSAAGAHCGPTHCAGSSPVHDATIVRVESPTTKAATINERPRIRAV